MIISRNRITEHPCKMDSNPKEENGRNQNQNKGAMGRLKPPRTHLMQENTGKY